MDINSEQRECKTTTSYKDLAHSLCGRIRVAGGDSGALQRGCIASEEAWHRGTMKKKVMGPHTLCSSGLCIS